MLSTELLLLYRIHGLTRPCQLQILDARLHRSLYYTFDRILHVRLSSNCIFVLTLFHVSSFDTSMSQKSRFKMQLQGTYQYRWTFPQLPWGMIENPTYIQTGHGCAAVPVLQDNVVMTDFTL